MTNVQYSIFNVQVQLKKQLILNNHQSAINYINEHQKKIEGSHGSTHRTIE
jgi:hypothetical protein